MFVELSAVKGLEEGSVSTCNHDVEDAVAFAVYISNPLAYHVQDFEVVDYQTPGADQSESKASAYEAASKWATGLAEHLGCAIEIRCQI